MGQLRRQDCTNQGPSNAPQFSDLPHLCSLNPLCQPTLPYAHLTHIVRAPTTLACVSKHRRPPDLCSACGQTTEQLKSLESRLRSCWSLRSAVSNPMPYNAGGSLPAQMAPMNGGLSMPLSKPRLPVQQYPGPGPQTTQSWLRSSAEGLDALKAQFSGMDMKQGPR